MERAWIALSVALAGSLGCGELPAALVAAPAADAEPGARVDAGRAFPADAGPAADAEPSHDAAVVIAPDASAVADASEPPPADAGVVGCTDRCVLGELSCDGNAVVRCQHREISECAEPSAPVACPAGSTCSNGACVGACPAACVVCVDHAAGKRYTIAPAAATSYPDTREGELTDEVLPPSWPLDGWVAWSAAGTATITVDLGRAHSVSEIGARLHAHGDFGIRFPASLEASISDDGVSFRAFGRAPVPAQPASGAAAPIADVAAPGCDAGRFVRITLRGCDRWCAVGEVTARGTRLDLPAPLEAPGRTLFGGFEPVSGGPGVERFAALSGKVPSTMLWYAGWSREFDDNPGPHVRALGPRGIVLQVGWEPNNLTLAEIVSGAHDAYVQRWARSARAARWPVFVRMLSEMNSTWTAWSGHMNGGEGAGPQLYREAWRRIVRLARAEGAYNLVFVWSPNPVDYPDAAWNRPAAYYPGPDFVDWIGTSVYDDGGRGPRVQLGRMDALYGARHPLMMSEGSAGGAIRERWIAELFTVAGELERLGAITWFDATAEWSLVEPSPALDAWRAGVAAPRFVAGR